MARYNHITYSYTYAKRRKKKKDFVQIPFLQNHTLISRFSRNAEDQAEIARRGARVMGIGDAVVSAGVGGVFGRGPGRCLIYRLVKIAGDKISPRDLGAKVDVAERGPLAAAHRVYR